MPIKLLIRVIFFVIGAFLLYHLIQKFGADQLIGAFKSMGWNIIYILIIPIFWLLVQTHAWQLTVEETGQHITFWHLFCIKMSGDAANTFTPLGFMGGDPVRFSMMKKKMPGSLSAASIVLDRTMQSLSIVFLLIVSLLLASFSLNLPHTWKIVFPIVTALMVLILWFFIHHQKNGFFEKFFLKLHKLGIKKKLIESLLEHLAETDKRISHFYHHNRLRFLSCFSYHVTGRFLGVVEIYLIAHFLGTPLSWLGALFMASLAVLVNILFVFIPGSMGVMEGAYGALCLLLGVNPVAGVAIQLVRRLRAFFWISLGVIFMLAYSPKALYGNTQKN